ncbi:uncharacterized protein B4 isoform X1 [Tribolium castaneum]|uniref:CABIT domain-containing protein n=1 Tax=Tribolium castaneum TaxID=7070 RepID=D6WS73_TRICA|nr:PREDICTED: uncharacterized protein LOC664607 isoform X2 [Tribolium castaneum]XP_015837638.1 PREDICTED: uncharacterized protein LOC664607 isoform X2 [Tribolium castaneum]XP_975696.1 PREDICTED: uncharacterized protein LOC664607 isoform X2 [Tribolium castaneum]EFA07091.2 hypothetical protein TcasGA2_TC010081 [Tribolium castaneum]|eukprot:XP_008196038.1 PREDICTED: uncharacterized protein LOC664607 isoform X2 [Tribolium castaneum]
MFANTTISSRSSSSCSRDSSMPSLRMRNPLSPKTSYNPLFRHSDAFTSFDASHFIFQEQKRKDKKNPPILRRYHSHDSHHNFDDMRIDSKDDTPDSTKSRASTGSESGHEYEARDFLERYSLPRVVRVSGGEPLLLYRCFDSFTKIEARGVFGKKGKEKTDGQILHFPEGYSGWFSLTNEKGEKSAVVYTSVLQLVREQVCSFVSMQPFTAYASQTADLTDNSGKVQYLKTQVRAGQLFQLRAVFQHKERPDGGKNSTRSSRIPRSARDKDLANRYAQLVSQNNQELYVPLTAKGEFYEIHSSMKAKLCFPGMLDKTGPLALDKDCLYRITHLLRRVALPVKVKLITGPLPPGLPKDFTDTFILENKFQEPLMVTCTLPPLNQDIIQHQISCINLNSNVKLSKSTLGFDSENRLFKSQRLQAALAFCHKNVESWYREVRLAPDLKQEELCPECRKTSSECEGNCAAPDFDNRQIITKEVLEKFPKPKKWYKHFKLLGKNDEGPQFADLRDPLDGMEKGKSIERYKDMSKLIEEKFGRKSYNPVKKSASFMFSTKRIDLEETNHQVKNNPALLKCQSLDTQLYSIAETQKINQDRGSLRSYDFQMCILDETSSKDNLDEIKPISEVKLKKTKPDLIPTLPKADPDHSYITERLCSEFHVKTKVQKSKCSKMEVRLSGRHQKSALTVYEPQKTVIVQVHEVKSDGFVNVDDIPYSHVADEVCQRPSGGKSTDENIYAEICESSTCTRCDNSKLCECKRTKKETEYCYVKLGSNGDSVTQSDSDEAIYNTLR